MTTDPDIYSLDWLREQLALMARWRRSLAGHTRADTRLAVALTRHEAWLEARLADLMAERSAA